MLDGPASLNRLTRLAYTPIFFSPTARPWHLREQQTTRNLNTGWAKSAGKE